MPGWSIVKNYNALIEKYGHAYDSKALDIERKDTVEYALSGYCIISICIHGWKHHQVSTNQTVNSLVKIFDYIKNPKNGDPAIIDVCRKLDKHIERVFWATELPFLPDNKYGRLFMRYPDQSDVVWNTPEEKDIKIKKRARAFFLMLYFELHGSMRPRYARECERIRSSVFFRYSQYKSQVMFNCASDEQRTRLSHSLEVAGAAKTIATQLGCNWELVEAMALGHVPFGHQGEEQLDECLHNAWAGRFSHSLQSVKVLNEIAIHSTLYDRFGVTGLCLSRPVLEGVLKHDTDNLFNDIRRAGWRLQYNGWREALIRYDKDTGKNNETEWEEGLDIGGLESQIVYWSDKIAYAGHDWDELAQSGYIDQISGSLDTMFKRMHQISHMVYGSYGNTRPQVNYLKDVRNEIDVIYFIRFVTEEIRNALVTKQTKPTPPGVSTEQNDDKEQDKIENKIFLALRPWANGDEVDNPIETYKEYPLYHLIHGLDYIIENKIETKKIKLRYFTKSEYKQALDFFSVVYHWIKITGIYPRPYKKSDDFLWVLCCYLTGIDNRIAVQALQVHLIECSRGKILEAQNSKEKRSDSDKAFNEDDVIYICQDMFKNSIMDGLPKDIKKNIERCL